MPTILITGASGGLAQEMVKLLPNDQLILLGRNKEKLAQLYGNHPHAELMEIDITDDSALEALVADLYLRLCPNESVSSPCGSNEGKSKRPYHQYC